MNENRIKQLRQYGWSLKFDLISDEKLILDLDLRTFGEKTLPDQSRIEQLDKPFVVQLHKTRNVTASKENESSNSRNHLYRLTITDGQTFQNALVLPSLKNFSFDTPPGVKLLLKEKTKVSNGFYLLNDQCCQVLGGNVEELVHKWKLMRLMGKYVRTLTGEGAPPPWVPFGTRVKTAPSVDTSQRSMDVAKVQQPSEEDPEFLRSRRAAIDTLMSSDSSKIERFARQDLRRAVNLRKSADEIERRPAPEKPTQMQKVVETPAAVSIARLPDWAKNQIADDADEHEPRRETYGRHRRNRAEETQEVRPSKDVTLFDFMSSTSKQKKDSKPKDVEQHKPKFPFNQGDQALVRYAEDNEYYPAVIMRIMSDKKQCVVMFEGYENEEIVAFEDVEPFEEGYYEEDPTFYYPQQQYGFSNSGRQGSARNYH